MSFDKKCNKICEKESLLVENNNVLSFKIKEIEDKIVYISTFVIK